MKIGYYLKQTRKLHKKTQEEISKATGITQASISFWENNINIPNIVDCIKLADYYNISLDELIGRDF